MVIISRSFFLVLLTVIIIGCASTPLLSRDKAVQQHESILELSEQLENVKNTAITHLAPNGFEAAALRLEMAIKMARQQQQAKAELLAKEGHVFLHKALADVKLSNKIMREVLSARQQAIDVGAPKHEKSLFASVESKLHATFEQIERNKIEDAKKRRPELLERYADLELRTLKKNILRLAKADIEAAKNSEADEYAPKTFQLAEKELGLAVTLLNTDRNQTTKAKTHATRSSWLANQSIQITDIVKSFKWRDYTPEEIVIWYQQQLTAVNNAIGGTLPFDRPNHEVVLSLHDSITSLIDAKQLANKKLLAQTSIITEMSESNRKTAQRYEKIQALFPPALANVYRQGHNVLLETYAFNFPPGTSELHSENFELLNKIVTAIKEFSNYRVVVTGHTDSTGSAEINRALSLERAKKVVSFLEKVGGIDAAQTEAKGLGESRPVASNKTSEGRAQNRRIEVLIIKEDAFSAPAELLSELE